MHLATRCLLLLSLLGWLPFATQAQPSLTPAQWRQDLQVALDSFLLKDRTFSPTEAAAFRLRVEELRDSAELKTTPQLLVGMAKALALSGNGHTRLYLLRNRTEVRRYPIRVWWFREGLYIVKTTPEYAHLLGTKVERLAGRRPTELLPWVTPLFAGSAGWARYMSTYSLTSPEMLQGLGLIGADGRLALRVKDRQGHRREQLLEPLPLQRTTQPTEAWWDLAPTHPGRGATWQSALPADTARLPLYLRRPLQQYWQQYLPAQQTLYVQYNRAGNQPGAEPLDSLARRALSSLRRLPVAKVVVDLRFNTGGNLQVGDQFFEDLAAATQARGARLFVISGRATFSAAIYHVAQLRLGGATVVGEPAGDAMDFWAEGGNLLLPNSHLALHFANRFHSYSATSHPYPPAEVLVDIAAPDITPTLPVVLTARQYFSGHDPVLEAILKK